jgi:hypothetical protein
VRYSYTYHSEGNWTERVASTEHGQEAPIRHSTRERRRISYFSD